MQARRSKTLDTYQREHKPGRSDRANPIVIKPRLSNDEPSFAPEATVSRDAWKFAASLSGWRKVRPCQGLSVAGLRVERQVLGGLQLTSSMI